MRESDDLRESKWQGDTAELEWWRQGVDEEWRWCEETQGKVALCWEQILTVILKMRPPHASSPGCRRTYVQLSCSVTPGNAWNTREIPILASAENSKLEYLSVEEEPADWLH